MSLAALTSWLDAAGLPVRLSHLLAEQPGPVAVSGLSPQARPFFVAGVASTLAGGLVVTRSAEEARRWTAELEAFGLEALYFPAIEVSAYERVSPEDELLAQRQAVLAGLVRGTARWVVTTVKALGRRMATPDVWAEAAQRLRRGDEIEPTALIGQLVRLGYRPAAQVSERGEFSRRGGILDVFPPHAEAPVRLEWFGDELDSLRFFDPETQRSGEAVSEVTCFPTRELVLPEGDWAPTERRIRAAFTSAQRKLDFVANRLKAQTDQDLSKLSAFGYFEGVETYAPFLFAEMGTLLDYVPAEAAIVWDDHEQLTGELGKWQRAQAEAYAKGLAEGTLLPLPYALHVGPDDLAGRLKGRAQVDLTGRSDGAMALDAPAAPRFHGDFDQIAVKVGQWQQAGERVVIVTQQPQRAVAILDERGVSSSLELPEDPTSELGAVHVVRETLLEGFRWEGSRLVLLTDLELFGQHRRASARNVKKFSYQGSAYASVTELRPGDHVVHVKHGIGKYVGLTRLNTDNQEREYLALVYAGDAKLYVPAEQINLLHRYRGAGEANPKLHKMGGADWDKAKRKARAGVQELADDLVKLYALRASQEGYSYPPDTLWQREMEEAFPYTETPDQLKAIEDTKRDMERPRPMDRLVCGDVGFGKTEVAIRAAFKALMAGKQVAVLAPTTVLAQQHYHVFKERFAPYPIRVGLLSRFRTAKEQREVVAKLKTGELDLVIGTHRLLSKDMGFKDLGLLVIDEEHRFGVASKERLKFLKHQIDVLTMSATPIPRTLSMALGGTVDMSLISTPPMNRQPVRTHVGPYDPEVVRTAVLHELERGGQVFFLHNRIESIGKVQYELSQLVPEARVRVAHGQLSETELEDIMLSFKDHEFDVLLSTTIIESGLDIPNANTMVIDHADKLGLAQLYQLRGRVGRSETRAYCYCLYPAGVQISDDARDRLQALQQFAALGSGYQIALRDLEIRGVGNMLGPEQSGSMVAVGFEVYTQLLEEAIELAKGAPLEAAAEPAVVDLNVTAFLPDAYLGEDGDKMAQYRRLAAVTSERELAVLESEWRDRFGPPPMAVKNLLRIVNVKLVASELGLTSIRTDARHVRVAGAVPPQAFYKCQAKDRGLIGWSWTANELTLPREKLLPDEQLSAVERLLKSLADCILAQSV